MSATKRKLIIIDVNLWISYIIGKGIKQRFELLLTDPRFDIIVSDELINEFLRVSKYKSLQKFIDSHQAEEFADIMRSDLTLINPSICITGSPDPKDDYLLSLSAQTYASYLLTGDKPHLLKLKRYNTTIIISFSEFCKKFNL